MSSLLFALPTAVNAQATPITPVQKVSGPTITVGPATLVHGGNATITYSDPSKAGETITVTIDNGMRRNPQSQTIEIQLNADGQGSANWVVPNWAGANFNSPGCEEVNRAIQ